MSDINIPARTIKSYVRRSGRLTSGQKKALERYWPDYGLDFETTSVGFEAIAQGFNYRKLEIGIGNGEALIAMARKDPDCLYLGVEVHQSGVGRCLNDIHDEALSNIRLIAHDAIEVMQRMLPPQSIDQIFLFFPDPWPKKRHHKRRIVNQQFRDLSFTLLKSGGCLHLATDWQDYAERMGAELLGDSRYQNRGDQKGYSPRPSYRPETRFEKRGMRLGHGVWDLVFEKK
jgi:tRNA (guanine-N7-)-methyltransferase